MARGIWKNSLLKIFLTRSFLGPLFRPWLYSAEEQIHYTFMDPITALTVQILTIANYKMRWLAYYWLVEVPKTLFEDLFLTDEYQQRNCCVIDYATSHDGSEIAYLTQGYVLVVLEHFLQNDNSFRSIFGVELSDLRQIISGALGLQNPVFYYQKYFDGNYLDDWPNTDFQQLYIAEVINHLADRGTADMIIATHPQLIQVALHLCKWKLANAKYSTLIMLKKMS